jgi:transposase
MLVLPQERWAWGKGAAAPTAVGAAAAGGRPSRGEVLGHPCVVWTSVGLVPQSPTVTRASEPLLQARAIMSSTVPSDSHIGIDVAKLTLDLCVHETGQAQQFPNTPWGHRQLIAFLQPRHPRRIVLEASGGYEKALLTALVGAPLPTCCVQPQEVRHFAKALKIKAKNDRIDACLLARFAHDRHDLVAVDQVDPIRECLRQWVVRRRQLVEQQTMEKNHLGQAGDPDVQQSIRRVLAGLKRELARVQKQIQDTLRRHPDLEARAQKLQQTQSIGPVTTAVLVGCLPELGHTTAKALNSLVGVAPYARDSGGAQAPRHIAGGRRLVRNALYMACTCGLVHNDVIRPYYQRLRTAGLAHKSAMMACIRKLIAYLNKQLAQLYLDPIPETP